LTVDWKTKSKPFQLPGVGSQKLGGRGGRRSKEKEGPKRIQWGSETNRLLGSKGKLKGGGYLKAGGRRNSRKENGLGVNGEKFIQVRIYRTI